MTSERQQVFVWVWLPRAADPVVAGRLDAVGEIVSFTCGRSYLAREDHPESAAAEVQRFAVATAASQGYARVRAHNLR